MCSGFVRYNHDSYPNAATQGTFRVFRFQMSRSRGEKEREAEKESQCLSIRSLMFHCDVSGDIGNDGTSYNAVNVTVRRTDAQRYIWKVALSFVGYFTKGTKFYLSSLRIRDFVNYARREYSHGTRRLRRQIFSNLGRSVFLLTYIYNVKRKKRQYH